LTDSPDARLVSLERIGMHPRGFMRRGADAATARQLALRVGDRQVPGQANVIAFGAYPLDERLHR
jgi:hypothetical protein